GRPLVRGSVIDNTEHRRRERIQRATYQISEAAQAAEDLARLYEGVHEIIGGLMPARNFYIALYNPQTGLISFPYFVDERDPRPAPFPINDGLTGHVIQTGRTLLADRTAGVRKQRVGERVVIPGVVETPYTEHGQPTA